MQIAPPQVGRGNADRPGSSERAGSIQTIIKAKSELVEALPPAPDGVAILNLDDENVMTMVAHTRAESSPTA